MTRAIDLIAHEPHANLCDLVLWPHGPACTCGLSARQQAARDLDARVAALEAALDDAAEIIRDHLPAYDVILDRIDALLSEVDRG